MRSQRLAAVIFALGLLGSAVAPAVAVEGEAAPPELCTLEPRTIESIEELVGSETLPFPEREAPSVPFEVPDGDEPSTKTRLEVKKDLRRAIACINTGSLLSSLSTFTDSYVQRLILDLGGAMTPEIVEALTATTAREPEEYVTIIDYQEMVILPDDTIMAVVYGDDPLDETPPSWTVFYLSEVDRGRWLVDDFVTVDRSLAAEEATPQADD